jgi:AcrR family transcriptional regulator
MPTDSGGREAILDTSAKLFSQQGYNGVSIRDIAQACGMTNAALYYHFKNKDDLFLAVVQYNNDQVAASLNEALSLSGDLRTNLTRLITRYAEVMGGQQRQSFQTLWRDMSHIGDARVGKLFAAMRANFMRPILQLIEAAQASGEIAAGDARLYGRLLHGMVIALTHEGKPGRQTRVTPEDVDILVNVFLEGVGTRQLVGKG